VALALLCAPDSALAQQARVSVRVSPFSSAPTTPLFDVDLVEPSGREGVRLPSLTLTNSMGGPEVTNLALGLPELTVRNTPVASRLGDQQLPGSFLLSPLSAPVLAGRMRGVSIGTRGSTPWTFSVGRLQTDTYASAPAASAPSVAALALTFPVHRRLSVAPRLLGSNGAGQASVGTAIRTGLTEHLSLVSDVGAAASGAGWAPLASASIVGHWGGVETESSVLRGARPPVSESVATVGSVDRELMRGKVQLRRGLSVSGGASRSRPAYGASPGDTTLGSVSLAYDRGIYGQVSATRQREHTPARVVESTRLEWRHRALDGMTVRYLGTAEQGSSAAAPGGTAHQMELDLPAVVPPQPGRRLSLRAALAASSSADRAALGSRLRGRFDIAERVSVSGETEVGLVRRDDAGALRALRLMTDVNVLQKTAVQLLYSSRAGAPFSFGQALEIRVARTFDLFSW
jgi:hypothetical protein